ncbi:MAG: helix-turn-helix transcriptional regulator [Ktedonobacteraceae bacterium]|nr:helix-turn-helix transcriptional regulator [Ktedonobacteraceae bacterium]MBA3915168.1 helix-turn-helix transcriptional regulator [Terriglobales bacterium]
MKRKPEDQLTLRELRVAQLVSEAKSNAVIAKEMEIKICTVKSHITAAHKKTGSENRMELMLWFQRKYPTQEGMVDAIADIFLDFYLRNYDKSGASILRGLGL